MSVNLVKMLSSNASRMLSGCVRQSLSTRAVSSIILPVSCRRADVSRSFTRSIVPTARYHAVTRPKTHSRQCGCCAFHTEGDRELVQFLDEEIKLEKGADKNPGQAPKFKGFDVSVDAAEVTISKKSDGETLTIEWNVTDTVADDEPDYDEPEKAEEEDQPIVSKPMFRIYINKGSEKSVALQCGFPQDVLPPPEGEPNIIDALEIHEVAMVNGIDWDEKTYSVMSTVMDGDLYALLMNTLEDRGINQDFMEELLEFSTHYEHRQYISFLQGLQDFARK